MNNFEIYPLIVAGGKGLRMKSDVRKQYIEISGAPLLARTLDLFSRLSVHHIVIVIPEEDREYCLEHIIAPNGLGKKVCLVSGGAERQQSVMNGLRKVKELSCSQSRLNSMEGMVSHSVSHKSGDTGNQSTSRLNIVLIHDGVRPFVDHEIITRCIEGAVEHGACIPAIPVSDTLKRMDSRGFVSGDVERKDLYQVQTPQTFELDLIIRAHEHALISGSLATDDASLVEQLGINVFMTPGSGSNIKITTREDLLFAEYMVSRGVRGYSY